MPLDLRICPRCKQEAPLVYRGGMSYCTACGAPRVPLAGQSVNMAGQPAKIGGLVARVTGWFVIAGGLFFALATYALCAWIFPPGAPIAWILALPIAVVSVLVGWALLRGGKTLHESGAATEKKTRMNAIYALAAYKKGSLTAAEAAIAANLSVDDADRLLTQVAKDEPEYVQVDLDDRGAVRYRFPTLLPEGHDWEARLADAKVRVDSSVTPPADANAIAEEEAAIDEANAARRSSR